MAGARERCVLGGCTPRHVAPGVSAPLRSVSQPWARGLCAPGPGHRPPGLFPGRSPPVERRLPASGGSGVGLLQAYTSGREGWRPLSSLGRPGARSAPCSAVTALTQRGQRPRWPPECRLEVFQARGPPLAALSQWAAAQDPPEGAVLSSHSPQVCLTGLAWEPPQLAAAIWVLGSWLSPLCCSPVCVRTHVLQALAHPLGAGSVPCMSTPGT